MLGRQRGPVTGAAPNRRRGTAAGRTGPRWARRGAGRGGPGRSPRAGEVREGWERVPVLERVGAVVVVAALEPAQPSAAHEREGQER